MAITAITALSLYAASATPAFFIITNSAESEMMYGITLVTTARLTSALNCSLSVGEMVDSAIADCTMPITTMPASGAPMRLTLENTVGKRRSSAAALAVCAMVNCQPSSEPRQAITASAMMIEPMVGLNILA